MELPPLSGQNLSFAYAVSPDGTRFGGISNLTSICPWEAFEGNEESVAQSDNDRFSAFNDATSLACQIELLGQFTASTAEQLRIGFELSVARAGLSYEIDLYNYSSSSWVFGDGGSATLVDQADRFVKLSDATEFFNGSHQVKARVSWQPINDEDPSSDGWLHNIDHFYWRKLG